MQRQHITLRIDPSVIDWMFDHIKVLNKSKYKYVKSVAGVIEALVKEQAGARLGKLEPGKYERDSE